MGKEITLNIVLEWVISHTNVEALIWSRKWTEWDGQIDGRPKKYEDSQESLLKIRGSRVCCR